MKQWAASETAQNMLLKKKEGKKTKQNILQKLDLLSSFSPASEVTVMVKLVGSSESTAGKHTQVKLLLHTSSYINTEPDTIYSFWNKTVTKVLIETRTQ